MAAARTSWWTSYTLGCRLPCWGRGWEGFAGPLFADAVGGRAAGKRCWNPPQVRGDPGDKESEVAGGTVEITRGRGRNCQFCSPDLLAFRSIADSLICFTDRSRARGWECYQNVLAKNPSFEVISLHGPTGPPKLKKCSKNGPNHLNRFVFAKAYSNPLSCWIVFETLKILLITTFIRFFSVGPLPFHRWEQLFHLIKNGDKTRLSHNWQL